MKSKRQNGAGINETGNSYTLDGTGGQAVAFTIHGSDDCRRAASETDVAQSLRCRAPGQVENCSTTVATTGLTVRRLTPLECERLQGLPDNWTAGESDSTRYRMIGNGVAVPVLEWIGRRIMAAENR